MKAFLLRHQEPLVAVVVLLLLSIVAAAPMSGPGWFDTHEGTDPLERVIAIGTEVRSGDLYPRWLSDSYGGKGSPFTNFYSPAFYLAAGYLFALGVPLTASLKVVLGAMFFVGALGTWLWVRRHAGATGALLAAVLYLFAPYHFVDVYVRGALAEFAALALLPYLFLGIDLAFDGFRGALVTGIAAAGIVVTHSLSAFMIALFAAAYFVVGARRSRADLRRIAVAASGPVLGAGLSAFYWLPLFIEQRHLKGMGELVTSGFYAFDVHFVHVAQLFSTAWGFGASKPGPDDGLSFQIGILLLVGFLASFAAYRRLDPAQRRTLLTLQVLALVAVFLTTAASGFVYRLVPGLALVQFPWRFLGPAGLFVAAGAGVAADALRTPRPILSSAVIAACVLLSGSQRVVNNRPELARLNDDAARRGVLEQRMIGALCMADEYVPRNVSPLALKEQLPPSIVVLAVGVQISDLKQSGASLSFQAGVPASGSTATIPWFFFPGWEVHVDGVPVPVAPDPNGFLRFPLPAGAHAVRVRFGSTGPRRAGWIVSILTLALLGAVTSFRRRGRSGSTLPASER